MKKLLAAIVAGMFAVSAAPVAFADKHMKDEKKAAKAEKKATTEKKAKPEKKATTEKKAKPQKKDEKK